jgi:hypothetical protein
MNIKTNNMEFNKHELELIKYAMYSSIYPYDNKSIAKCEHIITKIDKMIKNIKYKSYI